MLGCPSSLGAALALLETGRTVSGRLDVGTVNDISDEELSSVVDSSSDLASAAAKEDGMGPGCIC